MANLPTLCICAAAVRTNVNMVWAAMGRGPNAFIRKVTDQAPPNANATTTHYLMNDESAIKADVDAWQAMASGDLPQISGTWGENGVIEAADAQAACAAANLQCYTASGSVTPTEHAAGVLSGRGLYLQDEPDP